MATDISSLTKATDVYSIQPGQYITCDYTTTNANLGTFSNLGKASGSLLTAPLTAAGTGSFNFICIGWDYQGRPYLMADRVIQTGFALSSNTALNVTTGTTVTIDTSISANVRLPNRDMWDKVVVKGGVSPLTAADTIWNFTTPCWTYELPTTSTTGTDNYVLGGATADATSNIVYSTADATVGFRPCLTINDKPVVYRGNPGLPSGITEVTDPIKLVPGTAISCEYTAATAGAVGTFANLGKATKALLPDYPTSTPDGSFYFICVGYTPGGYPKCIADRNLQSMISWSTLSAAGWCCTVGKDSTIDSHKCQIRIPNTTPYRHINLSTGNYGEWDAIFSLYTTPFKASNDVWNTLYSKSFTTAILSDTDDAGTLADGSFIIARGCQDGTTGLYTDKDSSQSKYTTSQTLANVGFRPVFTYTEIDASSRGKVGTTLPSFAFKIGTSITPGEVVPCTYTATTGVVGTFSEFGKDSTKDWILAEGEDTPDGRFNFICVGYTPFGAAKLIADRNIQVNISHDTLSTAGFCITTGTVVNIDGAPWRMRLMNTSTTRILSSKDYGEWDAIISLMTNKYITKASDPEIWNCGNNRSWTLATIATTDDAGTLGTLDNCIARGVQDTSFNIDDPSYAKQAYQKEAYASKTIGFRPVIWASKTSYSNDMLYRSYHKLLDQTMYSNIDFF